MLNRLLTVVAIAVSFCASTVFGHEPVSVVLTYDLDGCGKPSEAIGHLKELANTLNKRIGGAGSAKALNNDQIQIELYGKRDDAALESIKKRIAGAGCLEFRVLADVTCSADTAIVKEAKRIPAKQKNVLREGKKVARWVPYRQKEFGPVDRENGGMVKRLAGDVPEVLVLIDESNVTGEFLVYASKSADNVGGPAIHFKLNEDGAKRFRELTSQNLPDPATGSFRRLGVILDNQLLSAPRLHTTISAEGMISGGSMTMQEVDRIVEVLNAGSVPRVIRLVSEVRPEEKK